LISERSEKMPRKNDKWIPIGYDEEGYITQWEDDFAPVMEQIDPYVSAIEEHQLNLDWKEICDRVPALPGQRLGYLPRRSLQLLFK
jgi:hypothetical protein